MHETCREKDSVSLLIFSILITSPIHSHISPSNPPTPLSTHTFFCFCPTLALQASSSFQCIRVRESVSYWLLCVRTRQTYTFSNKDFQEFTLKSPSCWCLHTHTQLHERARTHTLIRTHTHIHPNPQTHTRVHSHKYTYSMHANTRTLTPTSRRTCTQTHTD